MTEILRFPPFGVVLTFLFYSLGRKIYLGSKAFLLNSVTITFVCLNLLICLAGKYVFDTYSENGAVLLVLLIPSGIVLGLILNQRRHERIRQKMIMWKNCRKNT